ncbi:prolyl 4-hydroxylase subunit alpha-3 isoform X7 [Mirounga angustirostris]|uniref:prolyl 4-hydroxylase subunit alpha-3 isoform X7 n=1 Tax=Mirounga angustirostris TaxID=9716 RepID=UPI001E68AF97|nr:prolyl 4-hydroxylase subunit alpha-3 isoform X3 [Mirounga angustirostris]
MGPAAGLAALLAVLALRAGDPAGAAARGDTFSALTSVARALAPERRLLGLLRRYLRGEEARLRDLTRFYDKVLSLHEDSATPVSNPLLAFTLIKRLQSDWRNVVHSLEASENIRALKDGYEKVEQDLPAFEDVEGAARALMRLQDVYMLNVKGLARGVFQRVVGSAVTDLYSPRRLFSLTADDCFQVGKVAYDMGDYYHAIPWLEEAVSLFRGSYGEWKTEDEASLEDALDHLAFAYFQAGNVSCALSLSREFLLYSPDNKRMARNVLKYEKLLAESPNQVVAEAVIQRPNVPHLQTRDTYEGLCQTLGSQPTHYQIPSLYCSYETNSSPYLQLQPVRKEVIHLEPYVVLYHDFVSDVEAQKIRGLAEPWLQRSVVASGEKQLPVEYRISKSAWLKDTVDPLLVTLDHRIGALTGLDVQPPYAEYLQVVNYGIGGHYEPHFDHATSPTSPLYRMKSGNRVATFMIYLSSVEAGGATAFIYANFSVPVVKHCFGGICVGVVKGMVTHFMRAVLSWWEISGWPTSGYMSMDRSSADPAAQALKTKMLAERSWWSPVTFQRSQKPKARLGEEKGELPSGRGPCLHCLFLAKGSGLYQGTPENSQTISQSRMDGQYKEGGKRARGRSFWGSDTL